MQSLRYCRKTGKAGCCLPQRCPESGLPQERWRQGAQFRKHRQTKRTLPIFTRAILASAGIFAATLASAREKVPFALDWKFEGPAAPLKVAVTLAFIGTNLMEIVSPHGRGLGALFDSGKTNADYPLMFAVLIALAFLGIVFYYVVVALEKLFAGWAERQPT
jgi:hypothetical protein